MADIAKKITLYQQASQLAHEFFAKDNSLRGRAGLNGHVHEAVRREISAGVDDVVVIAAATVRSVQQLFQD